MVVMLTVLALVAAVEAAAASSEPEHGPLDDPAVPVRTVRWFGASAGDTVLDAALT